MVRYHSLINRSMLFFSPLLESILDPPALDNRNINAPGCQNLFVCNLEHWTFVLQTHSIEYVMAETLSHHEAQTVIFERICHIIARLTIRLDL